MRCSECHSSDSWNSQKGSVLTVESLTQDIMKYRDWITCVLFMGGEWEPEKLLELLRKVKSYGIKTALYTGLCEIPAVLLGQLNYVKYGEFKKNLGGLESPLTNQRLLDVQSGELLNKYFTSNDKEEKNGASYG